MKVRVVAQYPGSLHRGVGILFGECLQAVVGLLINEITLFDPPLDAARSAHPCEALLAVEDFQAVSVFHRRDAVVNRRNLVAERGLRGRDISPFQDTVPSTAAGGKQNAATQDQRARQPAYTRCFQQPHGVQGTFYYSALRRELL